MTPLVSLWNMLRTYAGFCSNMAGHLNSLASALDGVADAVPPETELSDSWKPRVTAVLDRCDVPGFAGLGLRSVSSQIARVRRLLDLKTCTVRNMQAAVADLHLRLNDELQHRKFLYVEEDIARYYESPFEGWADVPDKFPSATFDVEEAGKCMALGRGTACVFHLTRVLELGLRALARVFDIPYAPSWEGYLKQIHAKIEVKWQQKDPEWKKVEAFYKDVAGGLQTARYAWRNPTIHVAKKYTPEEATEIYRAVQGFMANLATQVDESAQKAPWA